VIALSISLYCSVTRLSGFTQSTERDGDQGYTVARSTQLPHYFFGSVVVIDGGNTPSIDADVLS